MEKFSGFISILFTWINPLLILDEFTKIRLYLSFYNWFWTKRNSFWFKIYSKIVDIFWFFLITSFRSERSFCFFGCGKRSKIKKESGALCALGAPNGFKNFRRAMRILNLCLVLKLDNGKVVSIANEQTDGQIHPVRY